MDIYLHCLSQSARLAVEHHRVAIKQLEEIEVMAKKAGFKLNRETGEMIKEVVIPGQKDEK